jgi:hypothetical protein
MGTVYIQLCGRCTSVRQILFGLYQRHWGISMMERWDRIPLGDDISKDGWMRIIQHFTSSLDTDAYLSILTSTLLLFRTSLVVRHGKLEHLFFKVVPFCHDIALLMLN